MVATTHVVSLARLCRQRVEHFRAQSSQTAPNLPADRAAAQIERIVQENIRTGRFARLCQNRHTPVPLTRAGYVDLVVAHWAAESPRVQRLVNRDPEEWQHLYASLRTSAMQILSRLDPAHSSASSAEDYAQRACIKIFESAYPFDVAFEAWIRTILKNLILEQYRSRDVLDHSHSSLDVPLWGAGTGEDSADAPAEVSDQAVLGVMNALEDHEVLEGTLRKLHSSLQRKVVELTYFQGLSDAQIAAKLGKTVANVQTLRHRALFNLNKLIKPPAVIKTARKKRRQGWKDRK